MSPEALHAVDEDGQLRFRTGNLCIHAYSLSFLQGPAHPDRLPRVYHPAHKKIPYADPETGRTVPAAEIKANTGVKLEAFIFDVFPAAERMAALDIVREDEFTPVKNAPGSSTDSPDTARALIRAMHTRWLHAVGCRLVTADPSEHTDRGSSDHSSSDHSSSDHTSSDHTSSDTPSSSSSSSSPAALAEVTPLTSYAGEGLEFLDAATLRAPCLVALVHEGLADPAAHFSLLQLPSGSALRASQMRDGTFLYEVMG
jgi:hypothetical protein